MMHRVPKIVQLGLIIASVALIASCQEATPVQQAPATPPPVQEPDPPPNNGQPLSWPEVLNEYQVEETVYAIGIYFQDGTSYVLGTGFAAYYYDALWTNAHVALGLRDNLAAIAHLNPIPFAVQSGTVIGGSGTYVLTGYAVHGGYDGTAHSPDVAIIHLDGELPVFLDLLPDEHSAALAVGERVATMGFPGELQYVYSVAPIATFKEGTISALRPLSPADPDTSPANTAFVQHNLDLSPGTSGSPIIDQYGWVIAINNAGTSGIGFDPMTGQPTRIPSGNIGWGIRIDKVWELIAAIDASNSAPRILPARRASPDTYDPHPENWDVTTVAPPLTN
jgi:hypothetical protein